MPSTNSSVQPHLKPDTSVLDATENRASLSGIKRPNATPLNDPG